jgi:hypothetical protein
MNRIIRQVFGTTRPRDIFGDMLTFDRMPVRPVIHIVYWAGLGLFVIAGFGMAGVSVGSALHDRDMMAWLLAIGVTVVGWLALLIGVLAWRAFCQFFMAIMNIADDLRYLRQFQERLSPDPTSAPAPQPMAQPVVQPVPTEPAPQPAPAQPAPQTAASRLFNSATSTPAEDASPMADGEAPKETGDILEDPFFRPRFGKKE